LFFVLRKSGFVVSAALKMRAYPLDFLQLGKKCAGRLTAARCVLQAPKTRNKVFSEVKIVLLIFLERKPP